MDFSAEQIQLVTIINEHVAKYPDTDIGNEQLLTTIYDYMEAFKRVMDSTSKFEMDYICQQYDGFYRFAKLMEMLAQGIADGMIEVPKDH